MDHTQLKYFLALWLTPQIGPAIQKMILDQYPNLNDFFNLTRDELKQIGFKIDLIDKIKQPDWKTVDATLEWAEQPQQHLITFLDEAYPEQLIQTQSAPTILLARGNIDLLKCAQLAIVGSRNPTQSGLQIAKHYSSFLAHQGLVITSGLALGIDAMAHQAALNITGKTIAVLGTGVNVIYPKQHQTLTEKIITTGLIVSEFPLNAPAQASNFPRRNRIISGLSLGTFVVEASIRSGSLITARYAAEQGREVFAMPSSVHNPMAKGCHWLIKQGANLIESVEDIWQQIQQPITKFQKNQRFNSKILNSSALDFSLTQLHINKTVTKIQQHLLDIIGFDTIGIQAISKYTSLNIEQLSVVLLELELLGYIVAVPGGYQKTIEERSNG